MKLGKMRYRAEFQRFSKNTDKDGFVTKEWRTVLTCWADVTTVSSREYLAASTETAETTVKLFLRYNKKIKNTMRVKVGEFIYEIKDVLHYKREGYTTVMAKEWDNGENDGEAPGGDAEETQPPGE